MQIISAIPSRRDRWNQRTGWDDLGWYEEQFVGICLDPVAEPTERQIRFVQGIYSYGGQNRLQIRQLLIEGGRVALGIMPPEDAESLGARLRDLGFSYSLTQERVCRAR